jgi:hypothetical protein
LTWPMTGARYRRSYPQMPSSPISGRLVNRVSLPCSVGLDLVKFLPLDLLKLLSRLLLP